MAFSPSRGLPKLNRTVDLQASVATILGYGPAGAGKTRSIRTLKEEGFNPIVIACELGETHGLLSLATDDIPYVVVENHDQIVQVIAALKKTPGKVSYEGQDFDTVVLDSITQWGEFPLDRFVQLKGWEDLHGINTAGAGKDPRQAYGFLAEKGRQLYKELFSLHAHLYIIAREGLFGGQDGEPLFAAPELPGQKLARELPGWPDATVRLRVVAGKHVMVTKGEGGSPARVRQPEALAQLPLRCQPNIGALIKYMCGDRSAFARLDPKEDKPTPAKSAPKPPA